jgi:hypothetical protein
MHNAEFSCVNPQSYNPAVTMLFSVHPISISNIICTPAGNVGVAFLALMWFSSQIIFLGSVSHQQMREMRRET